MEFYVGGCAGSSRETSSKQGAGTRLEPGTKGNAYSRGRRVPAAYTKRCLMEC